jgi:hypothetical protein
MKPLLFLLLLFPVSVNAQTFDYGKPIELRGLKRVFVDAGADTKSRDKITKEIEKAKLGVEMLDSPDTAEVILVFNSGTDKRLVGSANRSNASIAEVVLSTGEGMVLIPKGERSRLILSFHDVQQTVFERRPTSNFAREFIKAYKQANNIK